MKNIKSWNTLHSTDRSDHILEFLSFGDSETANSISRERTIATHHDIANACQTEHGAWICSIMLDEDLNFLHSSGDESCHGVAAKIESIYEARSKCQNVFE